MSNVYMPYLKLSNVLESTRVKYSCLQNNMLLIKGITCVTKRVHIKWPTCTDKQIDLVLNLCTLKTFIQTRQQSIM